MDNFHNKIFEPKKTFTTGQVRELLIKYYNEKITLSRLVEILNEIANKGGK